jgi:hypothetical protein
VREALDDLAAAFADQDEVVEFLNVAGRDLIRNVGLFLVQSGEESEIVKQPADTARDARFRRYMINVMVGREAAEDGQRRSWRS